MEMEQEIHDEGINRAVHPTVLAISDRNPMLNSVVLTRLLELCPLSDLPHFRLVSKQWYSLSLSRFRNEMSVLICHPSTWKQNNICKVPDELVFEKRLQWDWDELEASREKPFNSFRVRNIEFGHPSGTEEPYEGLSIMYKNMTQFWGKYGDWMRKLELWHPEVHQVDLFKKAIFEETPNLEELHLIEIDNKSESDPDAGGGEGEDVKVQPNLKYLVVKTVSTLPVSWRIIFLHFPNIQRLEVTPTHKDSSSIDALTFNLAQISEHMRRRQDSKFIVADLYWQLWNPDETNSATELLQIPQIILPNLSLNFRYYYTDGNEGVGGSFLSTAFLLHGHTLEKLRVTAALRPSPFEDFPFHAGPFNSLTTLDLSGNFCKNLHFLEHFPNLKYLGMLECNPRILQETDSRRMETFKLLQLTNFRFDVDDRKCMFHITQEAMEQFVKLMPNLEIFYGKLSNSSLRVACHNWRHLKGLRIRGFSSYCEAVLNNEGITGVVEGCEERLPNLTDLKDLKYLTIQKGDHIGDDSILNGFLKMPQLQSLSVDLADETSDEAYKALVKRFPEGRITRYRPSTRNSSDKPEFYKLRQRQSATGEPVFSHPSAHSSYRFRACKRKERLLQN